MELSTETFTMALTHLLRATSWDRRNVRRGARLHPLTGVNASSGTAAAAHRCYLTTREADGVEDPIDNMRTRAEQCRRLADITHDERMRWQLIDWANEIDADIERLEAERKQRRSAENSSPA
jgi:hypothetical protein